ncbi:MAG: alpha/beta fold hydrolase [Desulfobulbia bacterium]
MTKIESFYFTSSDNVKLHYLKAGSGPPLVILPGWTQPASGFSKVIACLADSYQCFALDYRAHGKSAKPNYGYRLSRLTKDCHDFLNHIKLKKVVLLGHSAGCAVIWNLIDLYGENQIRALVLCDQMITRIKHPDWSEAKCQLYGAAVTGDEALEQAATLAGPDGGAMLSNFLTSEFSKEFSSTEIEKIVENSLKVPRSYAAELMLSITYADYRDLLPRISCPTLCIGGQQSHLGPKVMPWIASQIPNGRVAMLNGRHFMYVENSVEFNKTILKFLSEMSY